jgi:hypothetical protein
MFFLDGVTCQTVPESVSGTYKSSKSQVRTDVDEKFSQEKAEEIYRKNLSYHQHSCNFTDKDDPETLFSGKDKNSSTLVERINIIKKNLENRFSRNEAMRRDVYESIGVRFPRNTSNGTSTVRNTLYTNPSIGSGKHDSARVSPRKYPQFSHTRTQLLSNANTQDPAAKNKQMENLATFGTGESSTGVKKPVELVTDSKGNVSDNTNDHFKYPGTDPKNKTMTHNEGLDCTENVLFLDDFTESAESQANKKNNRGESSEKDMGSSPNRKLGNYISPIKEEQIKCESKRDAYDGKNVNRFYCRRSVQNNDGTLDKRTGSTLVRENLDPLNNFD